MYDFDHGLFMALNFDGGPACDRIMLALSGTTVWIPLYVLILWLVWRQAGWRGTLLFVLLAAAAVGLADMICGIFKLNGPLGGLLPGFEARWRPMFTPSLEGLDITPDSLRTLRRLPAEALAAAGYTGQWAVHVPPEAVSGRFGTVSAHAATVVALAALSIPVIGRRWFAALMLPAVALICYSRIYLGKHFPMDLLWGVLAGLATGVAAYTLYRRLTRNARSRETR